MLRTILLAALLVFCTLSVWAEVGVYDLDYRLTVLLDYFVPGTAQFKMNQPQEGLLYLVSVPFVYGGYFFFLDHVLSDDVDVASPQFHASLLSLKFGETLQYYSMWAYSRDYTDVHAREPKRRGRETLWDLLLAPFKPENVFSWDVMPFFPLTTLLTYRTDDYVAVYNFFQRDHVDIWGIQTNPYVAAVLFLSYYMLLNDFVAVSEELGFRGLLLELNGVLYSSLVFGAMHFSSLLLFDEIDAAAVVSVSRQVIFTTLLGFWLSYTTSNNEYNFEKAIALHFWHNTLNLFLGTLAEIGYSAEDIGTNASTFAFSIPLFTFSY